MRFAAGALALLVIVGGAADGSRADMWIGPTGASEYNPGQWFVGPGVSGGVYTRPDWRAPFALLPDPGEGPPFQHDFNQNVGVVGPGLTIGHVFDKDVMPPWMGERPRLLFSFGFWAGRRDDRIGSGIFDDPDGLIFTQSGFVGINSSVGGGQTTVEERLESRFNAFELALRLESDRPVNPSIILTPSVGIFGGHGWEKFKYDADIFDAGVPDGVYDLEQRLTSNRFGADAGLTVTWLLMGGDLRLALGGRAGFYWVRSHVRGSDCFVNAGGSPCPTGAGTFVPNAAFNTTGSDSDSTIGVRGTVTGSVAYDFNYFTVKLGGFFTWESAVPGVNNPAANLSSPPGAAAFVGGPRVDFDSGYNTGGFLVVTIPLN